MANIALASAGSSATGTSTTGAAAAGRTIDGTSNTRSAADTYWLSGAAPSGGTPQNLEIDFGQSRTFDRVDIYWLRNEYDQTLAAADSSVTFTLYGGVDYELEYWNGSSWVNFETESGNSHVLKSYSFSAITATKIRVKITAAPGGAPFVGVNEIECYEAGADSTPPSDLTLGSTTALSATSARFAFTPATDNAAVTSINWEFDTVNTFNSGDLIQVNVASNTSPYDRTGLTAGRRWYARAKAKDSANNLSSNWSNTVNVDLAPTITTTSPLNNATIGEEFTQTLAKVGTTGTWSIESGEPSGMVIDATTGEISGWTPDTSETITGIVIRYTVTGSGLYAERSFSITVEEDEPSVLELNFEELQLSRFLNITQLDLAMPLLSADFGDGYGAGVLTGKESGLRLWTIGSECLPDQDAYSIDYTVETEDLTDTRFQYLWEFFRRHQALGNKPFWFTDPRTGRRFMASFVEKQISFEAFTAKLYSGSLNIKQRRVVFEGIDFRTEDGSVDED